MKAFVLNVTFSVKLIEVIHHNVETSADNEMGFTVLSKFVYVNGLYVHRRTVLVPLWQVSPVCQRAVKLLANLMANLRFL